ncbi:hypothetical protein ACWCQM_31270 [Streptomyces sp. NPDC002125]
MQVIGPVPAGFRDGTVAGLRIEEFPFPLHGVGIDAVWNPRLSDQVSIPWLREAARDVQGPAGGDSA